MRSPLLLRLYITALAYSSIKLTTFALFPSVGGRQFEVDNLEQLEWMGRFIGRIHAVSKGAKFEHRLNIFSRRVPT